METLRLLMCCFVDTVVTLDMLELRRQSTVQRYCTDHNNAGFDALLYSG